MRRVTAALLISVVAGLLCAAAAVLAPPASALSSSGDGTWLWRSPQPQGNWLNAVCAQGDSLWAVGDAGTLLHSVDDGATWAPQSSGTALDLHDVTFSDPLDGWAVGGREPETESEPGPTPDARGDDSSAEAGIVLHTTDGGLRWVDQRVSPHGDLWGVSFVGTLTGWAVRDSGVLHTTDGGQTWATKRITGLQSPASVVFADANDGVVCGSVGAVLHTTDGGAHWRRVALGSWARRDIVIKPVFADATHGWAIVMNPDEWYDNGSGRAIVATTDGGAHWRRLTTPAGLEFTSLLVGRRGSILASAIDLSTDADLFVDSTGGGRWSRHYVDMSPAQDMTADSAGLCAVGGQVLTRAGGGPWLPRSGWSLPLDHLQMFDDRHGVGLVTNWEWAAAGTSVARTTDGVTWDVVGRVPLAAAAGLAFPDAQHGWVVGSSGMGSSGPDDEDATGHIYATTDGGLTWQQQLADLPDTLLTGVSFADAQRGWVCGVDIDAISSTTAAVMLDTSDGGQSWQRESLPSGFVALAVDFISAQDGWAVGQSLGGTVSAHTVDGGAHWTLSAPDAAADDLLSQTVTFIDSQHGWATGSTDDGAFVVLATTDGGQTWTSQTVPGAFHPFGGVAFVSPEHGWLFTGSGLDSGDLSGGLSGSIWQTTDGGAHWAPEDSGLSSGIAVASVVDGQVYGANDNGFFSTVDRAGDSAPPATYDDFDGRYHRSDVAVHLVASDVGGGTVAATQYRIDADPTWHDYSGAIDIAAPADHANDGIHKLYYRSIDSNGNVEPSAWWWLPVPVPIDTLGPSTQAGPPATVVRGGVAHLAFRVNEKTSPRARVVIHILSASGRSVGSLVRSSPVNRAELLSGRCGLRPGRYRYVVLAWDLAGNRAVHVGWGRLVVKARGSVGSAPVAAARRTMVRPALPPWLTTSQWRALRVYLGSLGRGAAHGTQAGGLSRLLRVDHTR